MISIKDALEGKKEKRKNKIMVEMQANKMLELNYELR